MATESFDKDFTLTQKGLESLAKAYNVSEDEMLKMLGIEFEEDQEIKQQTKYIMPQEDYEKLKLLANEISVIRDKNNLPELRIECEKCYSSTERLKIIAYSENYKSFHLNDMRYEYSNNYESFARK